MIPPIPTNTLMMKCLCNHYSITLEFEEVGVGQSIECPKCNQETVLY